MLNLKKLRQFRTIAVHRARLYWLQNPANLLVKADKLLAQGALKEAEINYRRLSKKCPEEPLAYIGLAKVNLRKGIPSRAISHLRLAFELKDTDVRGEWHSLYTRALIANHSFGEAETYNQKLRESGEFPVVADVGLILCARAAGNNLLALERVEAFLSLRPNNPWARQQYSELLAAEGRFSEAKVVLNSLLSNDPENLDILIKLADNESSSKSYSAALEIWRDIVDLSPLNDRICVGLVNALIDANEISEAQAFVDQNLNSVSSVVFRQIQVRIWNAQFEFAKSLEFFEDLISENPENQSLVMQACFCLQSLHRSTGNEAHARKALALLDGCIAARPSEQRIKIREQRILFLISLGRDAEATKEISKLPQENRQLRLELEIWRLQKVQELESAKNVWRALTDQFFVSEIQPPDTLQLVSPAPREIPKESILLFTAVKNERWRLPWFMQYYRSLGVDYFFFVDNESSDGTREYLLNQPDVCLYRSDDNYAQACAGIRWINALIERHGDDCWCLYVDVDEALVFPGCESHSLTSLLTYMSAQGHEAMSGFMLDMVSLDTQSMLHPENYMGFISDYDHFENSYSHIPTHKCPFGFTRGGARKIFGMHENATKTPIIRGGKGISFLKSSHIISPAKISDVTCALLHFKMAGEYASYFSNEVANKGRGSHCNRRHANYLEKLMDFEVYKETYPDKFTRFESSNQLLKLGLLTASADLLAMQSRSDD